MQTSGNHGNVFSNHSSKKHTANNRILLTHIGWEFGVEKFIEIIIAAEEIGQGTTFSTRVHVRPAKTSAG